MRRLLILLTAFCLIGLAFAAPAAAQSGVSVTCDNGTSFTNGVEVVIVQMRTGFEYTATAIGINGFDPVLAVLNSSTGRGLCTDDDNIAAGYSANLPTTGSVPASSTSAQVRFSNTGANAFQDISLVVGGYNNTPGEFILVLEGMAVTEGDGIGDPFSIQITPGMVNSGVPLTAYMISRESTLDPTLYQIDGNYNYVLDSAGNYVYCDDAGDANTCWGTSFNLSSSFVTVEGGTRLPGFQYDSMLTVPLDSSMQGGFINLAATSYQQSTRGKYFMVFHMGNNPTEVVQGGKPNTQIVQQPTAVPVQPNNAGTPSGMSVTCDNGGSFDNGVEIQVNMRSGFSYTATAVGLNGFDPVLAVLDANTGNGLCTDDDSIAARYTANLPTTGLVPSSNLSSQVRFDYSGPGAFGNVSLVVGGFQNTAGEFLLIFEGMAVTDNDGDGDPFAVNLTPGMVSSGIPLTIYMISRENTLDPMINMVDPNGNLFFDSSNLQVYCDDAGNANFCYGTSYDLSSASVTTQGGQLPGFQYDSMLMLPLTGLQLNPDRTQNFFNFRMTSSQNTRGQYVLVFHVGMTSAFTPSA